MKSIIISFLLLFVGGAAPQASTSEVNNEWIKVFGLTVQKIDGNSIIGDFDRSSYKIDVFASTNFSSQSYYSVKTYSNSDDSLISISSMPRETSLARRQYLKLLDLASRQQWESIVYDTDLNCDETSRVVKQVHHLGRTQTIVTNCSENSGSIPEVSLGMQALIKRLDNSSQ